MKLKFRLFMLALMTILTVSCSDDDDDNDNIVASQYLSGSYEGYTEASFKYSTTPLVNVDAKATLSEVNDNTVKIVVTSKTWGTFIVDNTVITTKDGNYQLIGDGKVSMPSMTEGVTNEYTCSLDGTISSDKKSVNLLFDVPAVMGGTKIKLIQGTAPAAQVIAKSYKGTLSVKAGSSTPTEIADSKVTIVAQENGKATVTLSKFEMSAHMSFTEDIIIPDLDVVEKDGTYSFEAKDVNINNGELTVKTTVNGSVKDGAADITFSLTPGAMPFPIDCQFVGK